MWSENNWLAVLIIFLVVANLLMCSHRVLTPLMRQLWNRFRNLKIVAQIIIIVGLSMVIQVGGSKAPGDTASSSSASAQHVTLLRSDLPSVGLIPSEMQGVMSAGLDIENTQMVSSTNLMDHTRLCGACLTSITTGNVGWVSFNANSVTVGAWTNEYSIHNDVVYLPPEQMPPFDLFIGTTKVDDIYISSSGVVGLNSPAGSPYVPTTGMPQDATPCA